MSSHYDPIPIESDHEDNEAAGHMMDDDVDSERTRSTDRSHFFHEHSTDPDEEPEEDDSSDTDNQAPLLPSGLGRRVFGHFHQTARIRVTMPEPQGQNQPESSTPPPRPSTCATPGFHIWEKTLRTLKRWRDRYQYTPAPQFDSSSATRQEFLLDTTPIVVDKLARHEEKLDMIEDVIMDLPGPEIIKELQYQINNADGNISYVNDQVQALKRKVEEMTIEFKRLGRSVDQMENKMWDCNMMTAMALGTTQDNLRSFFKDQAGNGEN